MRLLYRSSRRHLLRHPWQAALTVLGVAVAVAVVVGIDVANQSAGRAFERSVAGVAGRATHEIVGGPGGLDETIYTRLRRELGWRDAAPIVDVHVALADRQRTLQLLGIDVFAEDRFRSYTSDIGRGTNGHLSTFLTLPGAAVLASRLAEELGVAVGDTLQITSSGRPSTLEIVAVLSLTDDLTRQATRDLLIVDLASAQEIVDMSGRLSRIDLVLGTDDEVRRLAEWLPASARLAPRSAKSGALAEMTRAFRLNLTALSLLALIVGMFLIYNAMTFSVVERRELLGVLRTLGVTRDQIFRLILAEAALVGGLGTLLGIALGYALATGLLQLVVRTINDLYFALSATQVALTPWALLKAITLGVGGTLLAAMAPAREAATAPPRLVERRSALEDRWRTALPRRTAFGCLLLIAAAGLLAIPSKSLALSFLAVLLVMLGFANLVPALTYLMASLLRPPMRLAFGILGSMAVRSITATLSRTGVAVAALGIAVAMTIGVSVMVTSFRATLVDWLATTLSADVYVVPVGVVARGQRRVMDPQVVADLRAAPGVDFASAYLRTRVASPAGSSQLSAIDLTRPAFDSFSFRSGRRDDIWQRFTSGEVIISEPYAFHHDLAVGDRIELATDSGPRAFPIAGVFYDYGTDQGLVTMARATFDRFWQDDAVQSLGIYARADADLDELIAELRALAGDRQQLQIVSNRDLRRASLEIFDRTFTITDVLRVLAVAVAFVGVLSSLMSLALERAKELGILRANGLTPAQVWGLVTTQTGLLGLVAGLLALPLGLLLATLLIYIINRRSFGWTLHMVVPPETFLQAIGLALGAALLAGLYPAYKMSRSSPALALREE